MFGTNEIKKRDTDGSRLQVSAIWHTIQGEGPYAGMPAIFVRLSGCTLRCWWCDTEWDDEAPVEHPRDAIQRIVDLLIRHPQTHLIVVTGGEPLRQAAVYGLYWGLAQWQAANRGLIIQFETSGSVWHSDFDAFYWWDPTSSERRRTRNPAPLAMLVCSPKTPKVHKEVAGRCWHYKYVIQHDAIDAVDGLPNRSTQSREYTKETILYRPVPQEGQTIWVSPCDEDETRGAEHTKKNYAAVGEIATRFGYRVSLQQHKIIGLP